MNFDLARVAACLEHTLLRADASRSDIEKICAEAVEFEFRAVCINPVWVELAARVLAGTRVSVCTVIDFPLGASSSTTRVQQTRNALTAGAQEIDVVLPLGLLKSRADATVLHDLGAIVGHAGGRDVKVILETSLLSQTEIERAAELAIEAGATFVKTSTGFGPAGADVATVTYLRELVGTRVGIKASGGIRDADAARRLLDAGATRLGTSASVAIMQGWGPSA